MAQRFAVAPSGDKHRRGAAPILPPATTTAMHTGATMSVAERVTSNKRVLAMPIVGIGDEPVEVAPATERMARQSGKMRASASVAPSISLEPTAEPTREQLTELLSTLGASHTKLDLDLAYLDKLSSAV